MAQTPAPLDPEKLKDYAKLVFGALGGAMTSAMIYLGDRLGLYRALAGGAPFTSEELAHATGLSERWLREWLHAQGAAGVLDHRGGGRFALSSEGEAVLANENHPAFGAASSRSCRSSSASRSGCPKPSAAALACPTTRSARRGARGIERGIAPWFRALLVPFVLPRVGGVVERLRAGAAAADVGCGAGVALLEMAKAFPRSRIPRLRHLAACPRAGRGEPQAGGRLERPLPRRRARPAARGRALRVRDDLRLPPRHDGPGVRDAPHPRRARTGRHLVDRRHQGARELRGERPEESDGRNDVRHLGDLLHVVRTLRARRPRPRHARAASGARRAT